MPSRPRKHRSVAESFGKGRGDSNRGLQTWPKIPVSAWLEPVSLSTSIVPRARDSGGSASPRLSVNPIQPSTENKSLGVRNEIDFGAESSRPTSSLSTLLFSRSLGKRQDSLPARYGFSRTGFSPVGFCRRFHRLTSNPPSPSFAWRDMLSILFSVAREWDRKSCTPDSFNQHETHSYVPNPLD